MYIPALYREEDRREILDFLNRNNFAALTAFDGEKITATHTPVDLMAGEDGKIILFGHIARANPQWKLFDGREVLLIFQGAHTYISPRWYNHVNVPTWNYMAIHVYGNIRLVEGNEKMEMFSRLVHKHEEGTSYHFEDLPPEVLKRAEATVAFAVDVTRIEAGYKLSQNRSEEDYENIIHELEKRGDEDSSNVALAMRKMLEKKQNSQGS